MDLQSRVRDVLFEPCVRAFDAGLQRYARLQAKLMQSSDFEQLSRGAVGFRMIKC
jgi:hypothetical protein